MFASNKLKLLLWRDSEESKDLHRVCSLVWFPSVICAIESHSHPQAQAIYFPQTTDCLPQQNTCLSLHVSTVQNLETLSLDFDLRPFDLDLDLTWLRLRQRPRHSVIYGLLYCRRSSTEIFLTPHMPVTNQLLSSQILRLIYRARGNNNFTSISVILLGILPYLNIKWETTYCEELSIRAIKMAKSIMAHLFVLSTLILSTLSFPIWMKDFICDQKLEVDEVT